MINYRLKSRDGSHDFAIETIKQYDLDLSAVLVYHNNDQLVALAHSIGDETIASPSQVTEGDVFEICFRFIQLRCVTNFPPFKGL